MGSGSLGGSSSVGKDPAVAVAVAVEGSPSFLPAEPAVSWLLLWKGLAWLLALLFSWEV